LTSSTDSVDLRGSSDALYKKVKMEETQMKVPKIESTIDEINIRKGGRNVLRNSTGGIATRSSLRNSYPGVYSPRISDGTIQTNTDII